MCGLDRPHDEPHRRTGRALARCHNVADLQALARRRLPRAVFDHLDLARVPRTELQVQLCGDAHLGNFRWYNAPDRTPVFDLNDFDETLPGPFDSDLCCRRGRPQHRHSG